MSKSVQALIDDNNTFVKRRTLLFIAFFIRRILGGIQFSIIIPSGWQYLKTFGAQPWLFGVTVALYHVSALISLPIAGMHYDRFQNLKALVTVFNVFEIIGNLVYALPFSVWCLLIGRMLSGVGGGFNGIISSEIASITTKEERLTMFARMELGHLLGLFIGPVLSTLFESLHLRLGKLVVDFRNAPGICCVILWLIMQGITMLMVRNIAKEVGSGVYEPSPEMIALTNPIEESSLNTCSSLSAEDSIEETKRNTSADAGNLKEIFRKMLSFEMSYIFISAFGIAVYILEADTMLPLLTQVDFKWTPVMTGIVYLVIGVEAFILFCLMGRIGRYFKDTSLLIACLGCSCFASLLWAVYGTQREKYHTAVTIFCIANILGVVCFVIFTAANRSLLSKVTSVESQGIVQSTFVMISKLANIIGPVFGSYAFCHMELVFLIFMGLMLVLAIWGVFSKKRLDDAQV